MGAVFLDEDGTKRDIVMGCYGIGVGRTAAAAIEQNHDERGIVWPISIAPFQVVVLPLQMNSQEVVTAGERLYHELLEKGIEVVIDDRKERAGVKFNDADLLGIPIRVAVGGKGLSQGVLEVKLRRSDQVKKVAVEETAQYVTGLVARELEALEP